MQEQTRAVIDLAAYRTRTRKLKPIQPVEMPERVNEDPLQAIAYHLLMAIRAVKSLSH